jgi:hypothetical protein
MKERPETSPSTDAHSSLKRWGHSKNAYSQNAILKIIKVSVNILKGLHRILYIFFVLLDMPNMKVIQKLKIQHRWEGKGHHHLKVDTYPLPAQTSLPAISISLLI